MCLAQGHNSVTQMRLEPAALRSRVKHSTTGPLRSTTTTAAIATTTTATTTIIIKSRNDVVDKPLAGTLGSKVRSPASRVFLMGL